MPLDELLGYFNSWPDAQGSSTPPLVFSDTGIAGRYRKLLLSSVFQPLFVPGNPLPNAHEALLRVCGPEQQAISPAAAFSWLESGKEVTYFDRLCRIVHVLNFVSQSPARTDLYLNVSGEHLLSVNHGGHGEAFERLLSLCGVKPQQIILEIIESRVDDLDHLNAAIQAYRQRGYRVAIDDFGCEHSNFDRLWRLTPDIVKLDRSLIVEGINNPRAGRIISKLVDIIHELGAQVVCEGIETDEQRQLACDAGADLLQGYLFARPSPWLHGGPPAGKVAASASACLAA